MLLPELKQTLQVLRVKHRLSRHKTTDNDEVAAGVVPCKVMHWSLGGLHFYDFVYLIVEEVQSKLSVVRLTTGVIVGLQLNQELVGGRAELNLYLFRLVYLFLVEGLVRLVVVAAHLALVGLVVQPRTR